MSEKRIEEIKDLLRLHGKVYVNELSRRYEVSEVSVRKYLAKLELQGFAERFYGGAALAEKQSSDSEEADFYSDPLILPLVLEARKQISDGDSIYIGSGRSCCVLARHLTGFKNLTVVTNNITAMPILLKNTARVFMIGGEATSTDDQTYFSSWETPEVLLKNIFVNKAFTSISGLDLKAGLTVDSIISTYIFKQIPAMAHRWFLMAGSAKFDKISIYTVAEIGQVDTIITDTLPQHYKRRLAELSVGVIEVENNIVR